MKLSLSANISKLRKEHAMTQEQLAEALGVTFASVSKWERGVATPELNLIAEMADLFEVSIDALIGYQFRNNNRETVITRLKQYSHDRDTEDVFSDVEKALQCYPNCFDVVYYSARIYRLRGLTQKNAAYSKKALSLCERACILIGQNKDPEISDVSVRREMAEIHFALGEYDKGIALLKENNPCRLNHSSIGMVLASSCNDPEGALPFLSRALLDLTVTHFEIVVGYMDKSEAFLWALRADVLLSLCKKEEAINSLRRAKDVALHFDESPNYDVSSIRFVFCKTPASAFDDFGDTAMIGVDEFIKSQEKSELSNLWKCVRDE